MPRNQNGIWGRLLRFWGLLLFRLIEKAGLVVQNIAVFLAGLTEPGSLGIGKDLIHVLQLSLQLRIFLLKQFNRICQRTNEFRYFCRSVCTFLSAAAMAHTPKK